VRLPFPVSFLNVPESLSVRLSNTAGYHLTT
jgi:hypothetical protein